MLHFFTGHRPHYYHLLLMMKLEKVAKRLGKGGALRAKSLYENNILIYDNISCIF